MQNDNHNTIRRMAIGVALFALLRIVTLSAQQPGQKTYDSPNAAVSDLVGAVRTGDIDRVIQIFGPDAKEIVSSGDKVADEQTRKNFLERYDQMNRLVKEPNGTVTLYIGAENWPFPITLINKNNVWFFDTVNGEREVLYRRIGRNEFDTIDTLNALVDAQKEFKSEARDRDQVKQFAQKLISDEGKHNGLYWKTEPGQNASPIGPLLAQAAGEGYRKQSGPTPFHGYIYRLLNSQGANAPGGAKDYMEDGKLTQGFAIVAYPAEYRNSGVMTFIVNQDGRVYQKDLGPSTATIASSMTAFNPDKGWKFVE
jgi:hypothetical protein